MNIVWVEHQQEHQARNGESLGATRQLKAVYTGDMCIYNMYMIE